LGLEGSDLVTAMDLATIVECKLGTGFTLTSEVGQVSRDLRAMRQLNPVAWQQIDATAEVKSVSVSASNLAASGGLPRPDKTSPRWGRPNTQSPVYL
jgi:hypothetical protein